MEPNLELSDSKAYVNGKWEENAAAGELVSIGNLPISNS